MRHAWSQPAHARAHPPASSSASAWSASPVPSAHLAHAAPPASAYPPLGATHADIAAASTHSNGIAGASAGVANASTALERVLAMLDGFEVSCRRSRDLLGVYGRDLGELGDSLWQPESREERAGWRLASGSPPECAGRSRGTGQGLKSSK